MLVLLPAVALGSLDGPRANFLAYAAGPINGQLKHGEALMRTPRRPTTVPKSPSRARDIHFGVWAPDWQ